MSEPSVSVIIPTYNNAKYIAESINSALDQTHPPAEILVIDDGSTDNTQAVVSACSDARIRYVKIRHAGTSAARNRGIELASGDYIAFLDADDLWRPRKLEKQVSVMEHDRGIICCFTNFVRFMDGTGEALPEQFDFCPELAALPVINVGCGSTVVIEGDPFVQLIKFGEIPAYMQCHLFRRSMIADMRLDVSLRRCQDLEFVSRVFMRGKVAFTREVLTDVRRHSSNTTKDISLMALDKLWALLALRSAVDTPVRQAALNDRLVKARIDAASAMIGTRRRVKGSLHYVRALIIPGSGLRKIKGTARLGYELLASLR